MKHKVKKAIVVTIGLRNYMLPNMTQANKLISAMSQATLLEPPENFRAPYDYVENQNPDKYDERIEIKLNQKVANIEDFLQLPAPE